MMAGRWDLFAGVMLAALSIYGRCAHAVTVRLSASDTSSSVAMHVGDRVRMELPVTPAFGFKWTVKKVDASHLETMGADVRPDRGSRTGAGTQVFVWKAISPGHAEINLEYSRPNDEKSVAPAKEISIAVDVIAGEISTVANSDLLHPIARFGGTLACSDCTGIAAELTLFADAVNFSTAVFVQRWHYLGAAGGDRARVDTGRVAVVHGTYADAASTVYVLDGDAGGNYRVEGDRLVLLDAQMLAVRSARGAEIVLRKLPETASTP